MAKKKGPEIFAALTTDENWILRAKLSAGAATVTRVSGYSPESCALSSEVHDVMDDLHQAYQKRWNSEHPPVRSLRD